MSLPNLPAGDKFRREVRTEWGGLNLNENAGDGELIEAMNMSSREYPLIANAKFTQLSAVEVGVTENIYAPFVYNGKMGYIEKVDVQGEPSVYMLHDPFYTTQGFQVKINSPNAWYAILGHRLIIMPSKQIYDFDTHTMADMEASWGSDSEIVYFRDGTINGVPAENNTIYAEGADWVSHFRVGDVVTISGSDESANNKSAIIREIEGDELRFDENVFSDDWWWSYRLGGIYASTRKIVIDGKELSFVISQDNLVTGVFRYHRGDAYITYYYGDDSATAYTLSESSAGDLIDLQHGLYNFGAVTITRTVPDMDFICVNENRVWGSKGDTIYASKLGDPLNWNVFDGLSTDSWTAETGTQRDFTGCCSFQGYPTFFKENAVFKILGDEPSNFVLRKQSIVGVRQGSDKSIVEIRGKLYYHSWDGIMEWNGGDFPQIVSAALGLNPDQTYFYAAGSDTIRYYVAGSVYHYNREYDTTLPDSGVYVYDPRFGSWHKIKAPDYYDVEFPSDGVTGFMLKDYSNKHMPTVFKLNTYQTSKDTTTEWRVTFADSTRAYKTALTGSESKKGVLRLLIRCRLAGTMKIWISYDGGRFEEAGEFGGEDGMEKTSRVVPLILRRCDYWQLRLTGVGDAVIYSIAAEKYGGEWQQA